MDTKATARTRLSFEGRVNVPKAIRDRRGWRAGTEFVIEEREDGVLRRLERRDQHTRIEDVFGSLGPAKRVVTIEEMNLGYWSARRRGVRRT